MPRKPTGTLFYRICKRTFDIAFSAGCTAVLAIPMACVCAAICGLLIGIPALRADAQDCCRLLFDGDHAVEIRFVPAQGRWLLSCALRGQRAEGSALQVLMQGNHMGAGFGGGWAGIDAQGLAVLHLPLALPEASASAMLNAIELLLNHVERWEIRLLETAPAASGLRMAEWAQRI